MHIPLLLFNDIYVTCFGESIAQAEESAVTKEVVAAAADAHLLHLLDGCDIRGPHVKG